LLDFFSAFTIDGVRHIRIEFLRGRVLCFVLLQFGATVIAIVGSQMVFVTTALAVAAQLTAGHGDERSVCAIDDFQVSDDKGILDRDRAEASQTVF
jgi:hypothetical protein